MINIDAGSLVTVTLHLAVFDKNDTAGKTCQTFHSPLAH